MLFVVTATVYGNPQIIPIEENCSKGLCTNPYGWTKSMLEQIFMDMHVSDPTWNIILLRYFNPIGAHKSGLYGCDPNGVPNNLMPYITQVAVGKLRELGVFGNDYDTHGGTGVRGLYSYCGSGTRSCESIGKKQEDCGPEVYNLGTGKGYSVLDLVKSFDEAGGIKIPYSIKPRRAGDIATCYCDPSKAARELGWKAEYDILDMCRDSWNWQSKNPDGYNA